MSKPLSTSFIPAKYNRQSWWQIIHRIVQPLNRLIDGFLFLTPSTVPVTSDYSASIGVVWIPVDATSAAVTITLPDADETKGKRYTIKKIDASANAVTVTATQTIDDGASATLNMQYESICVMSDGSEYWIV